MPKPNLTTQDSVYIADQFEAWMEGAVCRCKGLSLTENPYPSRSAKGDAWENGWETIDNQLPTPDIDVIGGAAALNGDELWIATESDENMKIVVKDRDLRWKLYCKKVRVTVTDMGGI